MSMQRWSMACAACSAAVLLSACGGGGSDTPAPAPAATDAIPSSASASAQGMKNYLSDLAAMPVDDKEPLDVASFAPPTPDDTEPEAVN